eukprot:1159945-Pyramimonas_sp.AAC.1
MRGASRSARAAWCRANLGGQSRVEAMFFCISEILEGRRGSGHINAMKSETTLAGHIASNPMSKEYDMGSGWI